MLDNAKTENPVANPHAERGSTESDQFTYHFFDLIFDGSTFNAHLDQKQPFEVRRNYIGEHGVATDVPVYGEWVLRDIYPGIDLRLYSQDQGHLEFDWMVWPGADPEAIRMHVEGHNGLSLSENGALQIGLGAGKYTLNLPESYSVSSTGKKQVDVDFALDSTGVVQFKFNDQYDKTKPLVIDPDLIWGVIFDGANAGFDEYLYALEKHPTTGLIYCAGAANLQVSALYAAALTGAYNGTISSNPDAFVYALTPDGQFVKYITYLGGTGSDVAIGLSLKDTSIFISGYTASANFPISSTAWDNSFGGSTDGFIAILNDSLNRINYSSFLGSTGTDYAFTVRASDVDAYVVSLQVSAGLPILSPQNYLSGAADAIFGGSTEAWIGRFDQYNQLRYGTYIGGPDADQVNDFQLLSNGSVMFVGSTKSITEVNASISQNNNTRTDALIGRIDERGGVAIFQYIEKFGGSNTDNAWGITCLADSVSIVVGQTTSGAGFPLGAGTPFQSSGGGATEGFIARFNNDGGGYKASYVGGGGSDILVSVRPIFLSGHIVLMSFGTTTSTNLPVNNYNAGTLYSPYNAGGQDMMFLICDQQLETKYYLSYIGGSANDYLGKTGVPWGSNHLYYDSTHYILYVGTTTHSLETTHNTPFVGRNPLYAPYQGLPLFDQTKSNGINDAHLVFAIEIRSFIISVLASEWMDLKVYANADCAPVLTWSTPSALDVSTFQIQRSYDGVLFHTIYTLEGGPSIQPYTDAQVDHRMNQVVYRIEALGRDGHSFYSDARLFRSCLASGDGFQVYPTWVSDHITIREESGGASKRLRVVCLNEIGTRVRQWDYQSGVGPQILRLNPPLPKGTYYLLIQDAQRGDLLFHQRLVALE